MLYRILADGVVIVHLAFIMFVAVGAVLAWRWPLLVWAHLPAVGWGVAAVTVGVTCPLTPLEKGLRRLAGEEGYRGGFVDHYLEGVVYPDEHSVVLRALAAATIVAGYLGVLRRGAYAQRPWPRSGARSGRHRAPLRAPVPLGPAPLHLLGSRRGRSASRPPTASNAAAGSCDAPSSPASSCSS